MIMIITITITIIIISIKYGNKTECSTIQGVIRRVILNHIRPI